MSRGRPAALVRAELVLASLALLLGPVLIANGGRAGAAGVAAGVALVLAGLWRAVRVFRSGAREGGGG